MITPREWGSWSGLINRFNIYGNAPLPEQTDPTNRLQRPRIWNPTDLCSLHIEEIHALGDASAGHGKYITLWKSPKCHFEHRATEIIPQRMGEINRDTDHLLDRSHNYRTGETAVYRDNVTAMGHRGLPANSDTLPPSSRTRSPEIATADGPDVIAITKAAGRLDIIRTSMGSIRTAASGIRRYVRFPSALGRNPFSPTEASVRAWRGISKHGWAYRNYIQRLKKA